ncbi:MAG TPA: response regulator [Candidatus Saccharimonadales bacterium]|nr:response regulator [Candidatus Saccharimonadales bacterium]
MASKRILIIEDEKPLREAFAFLLKSEGFDVDMAENGKVALVKLRAFRPDVLLLDMLMPVMSGDEFLRRAQLPTTHPTVKTLMLSNLSDAISPEDAAAYGVADSILKADLSPRQLAMKVKKMLPK